MDKGDSLVQKLGDEFLWGKCRLRNKAVYTQSITFFIIICSDGRSAQIWRLRVRVLMYEDEIVLIAPTANS